MYIHDLMMLMNRLVFFPFSVQIKEGSARALYVYVCTLF